MKLTDTALRSLKPQTKAVKLFDGGGLFLYVTPSGGKLWRLKYRIAGKEKLLALGAYPAVGLREARKRREEAREQIARGIDPGAHRKAVKNAVRAEAHNSYEVIAREWHAKFSEVWTDTTCAKVLARQAHHIFPTLGNRPVHQVTAPELLAVLRQVEKNASPGAAHRTLQDCGRIFRYAIATGRAERDPAADLRGALAPVARKNFASITNAKDVGALLRSMDAYEGSYFPVCCALRLSPLLFVRPGELRKAEWTEFDFDNAEWRIPAARMKMRQTHIVPLSRQALKILRELHPYTGHGQYLFPSVRTPQRPISDVTVLAALRRMGFTKEEMTVHGFRSMASTLLNELGYNRDWIERQLSHGERNSVRSAYNFAEYLPERRKMMQSWADYLG